MRSTVSTTLTEDQIRFLGRYGQKRTTEAGQVLISGEGASSAEASSGEVHVHPTK